MTVRLARSGIVIAVLLAANGADAAQLARLSIVAPALMSSTCSGLTNGSNPLPGDLIATNFPAELTCNSEQSPDPIATSRASYSNGGLAVSATSESLVTWGAMRLDSDFSGPNSATFPQASATAGWVDALTVTPTNPALIGQAAVLAFNISIEADLLALAGFNSVARLSVRPYVNDANLATPPSLSVQGQGQQGSPYQQTLDTSASFTIPIVLGTPFELGIFARASSGTASTAGSNLINTVSSDAVSIAWDGITSVTVAGQPIDVSISADSGIDWSGPVPEPSTGIALLVGSGALAALGSRRRN